MVPVASGIEDVLRLLLAHTPDGERARSQIRCALVEAINRRYVVSAKLLLAKTSPNFEIHYDGEMTTPLHAVVDCESRTNQKERIKLLVQGHGANVNAVAGDEEITPLHIVGDQYRVADFLVKV